jgi:hypothetical protein
MNLPDMRAEVMRADLVVPAVADIQSMPIMRTLWWYQGA